VNVNLRKWRWLVVQGVVGLVVLAACTAIVVRTVSDGSSSTPPKSPSRTVSLPVGGHSRATLEVLTGTPMLHIGTANLGAGGTLIKVTTAAGSTVPKLRMTSGAGGSTGTAASALVTLSVQNAPALTVTLNSAVAWQLDLAGGSTQTIADLRNCQLAGLSFTKGSDVIDIQLPRPAGSVPVDLAAWASRFTLALPPGVQARVTAVKGAGEVSLYGAAHTAVTAGSVFTTASWSQGTAGFDIDATAGAAHITVTTEAS
jgi:hypothetical protein